MRMRKVLLLAPLANLAMSISLVALLTLTYTKLNVPSQLFFRVSACLIVAQSAGTLSCGSLTSGIWLILYEALAQANFIWFANPNRKRRSRRLANSNSFFIRHNH